jgi:endonuclease/exonuclease/phosphatase family metal-dependent hydrolase
MLLILMGLSLRKPDRNSSDRNDIVDKRKSTIKVMTYNVRHCNPPSKKGVIEVASIAKVINDAKPDLVALQELDRFTKRSGVELDQAKELGRLTGMYSYFVKAIDWDGGEYGVAILSRFKILDSMHLSLPMADGIAGEARAVAIVKVKIKTKELLFASTHLDIVKEHRELQASKIVDYFSKSKIPVILAGDLNDMPESTTLKLFGNHFQLTCALPSCGKTFPQVNPTRTIDYIMYKPERFFKTVNHQVIPDEYASDHRPVMATLEFE